jgi:uncharacterized membrane protein|tara:strand:+ start:994 stop:1293 length:300 start_codon:yes stop_codon:yes gene_type:complete
MKKLWKWIKHRLAHKLEHFSPAKLKKFLKENGLAFVIIFIAWELIEDVVFPVLFVFLGNYVHPVFYAGAPASILLCFHWLMIPILWGAWVKLRRSGGVE